MCKQVIFKSLDNWNSNELRGGIGLYDVKGELVGVICGETGKFFKSDEVFISNEFEYWIDISKEIIGT